ncbi:132 kDa protein [Symbiodinium microadriaticum]|uniref:132 kDa protein n=1 Tax=Symbiodinium microadriaticum TaxID=2951 RepID=A0A1Q9CLU7_SYMMI|nr:132 kDa protein [Symbiodinium microadriaticum]
MREYSRGWVCCRGSPPQVLPCPGQRLPLPDAPAAAPQAPASPAAPQADAAWFRQGPPETLAVQRTHSCLFVPLLHAAVGRLHPAALAGWEDHPLYGRLWQRNLALLRQAPPVEPQALVHALHALQQLASEEGRSLPVPEAQLLLALAAESNRLPSNTLVHLPWAWRFTALPDGYIPASAQEALLHVYLGERAAASLLQEVAASHQNPPLAPAPAAPSHPPTVNTSPAQMRPAPRRGRSSSSSSSSTSSTSSRRSSAEPPAQPATTTHLPGEVDAQPSPAPLSADQLHGPRLQAALASLDPFDAEDVLLQHCSLFRSPPPFCKPQLRRALKLSLKLVRDASTADAPDAPASLAAVRAWKLFLFLPRLLLFRPAGAMRMPKPQILARFSAFERGDWSALLHEAHAEATAVGLSPATPTDSIDRRAQRATRLARLGELSAARQALTAEPLAPANAETLTALTDPQRRPPQPYGEIHENVISFVPEVPAAAPGPSGYTAETIRLVLDDEEAASLLCDVSCLLARARLPEPAVAALSVGRIVAIRKPSGGTRGLVVRDFLRRLVARTLAQQFASHFQAACNPHQYALSSRAGAEALVHTLQARTQADAHLTVVSVDATAAYDLVSREAMLTAVKESPALSPLLPFARLWYARKSVYLWCAGEHSHRICQSEGGEQGDPLMPALFSVALAPALHDLQRELRPTEQVLAYLDDVYILASPDRVALLYRRLEDLIWQRARLRLNASKTRVWNAAGALPNAVQQLAPDSAVWVGDTALSPEQRGLVALGVPLGSPAFIQSHLQQSLARHAGLLQTLPAIHDTQISWLLLSCCAAPRG